MGEANAIVPLIEALLKHHPHLHVLLTTVTVTSAALMSKRLPARALHQFAPVDTPAAVSRFITHWRPDVALWVDSELWPNLIVETHKSGAVMGIVNAADVGAILSALASCPPPWPGKCSPALRSALRRASLTASGCMRLA